MQRWSSRSSFQFSFLARLMLMLYDSLRFLRGLLLSGLDRHSSGSQSSDNWQDGISGLLSRNLWIFQNGVLSLFECDHFSTILVVGFSLLFVVCSAVPALVCHAPIYRHVNRR